MRLALVYIQTQRIYDAQVIAERLLASDPGNKTIVDFLRSTTLMKVTDRQRKALESQVRLKGLTAADGMKLSQIYGAMGNTSRLAAMARRLLAASDLRLSAQNLMEINAIAEMNRQYKLQREILAVFNRTYTGNFQGWVELAIVEIRDSREKGREKAMADCFAHLAKAVQLGGAAARKALSEDERFEEAVQVCGADFVSVLTGIVESDLPAQTIVQQAVQDRHKVDASGEIVLFPNGGLPWRDHLYDAERNMKVEALVKFVLYQDIAGMYVLFGSGRCCRGW